MLSQICQGFVGPPNERMGCWGDKCFLVFRIILVRLGKTAEAPAWASRFNSPFFHFPVSTTPNQCIFSRRIIIKNKHNHAHQNRVNHHWAEVPGDGIFKFPETTCAAALALWVYCPLSFASLLINLPNARRQITPGQEGAQHNVSSHDRAGGAQTFPL